MPSRSELIVFPNGETYRRFGECDGCKRPEVETAQCCLYVDVPDRELTPDETKWLYLHDLDESVPRGRRIDARCTALTENGDCSLVGTDDRPELCGHWPEHPDDLRNDHGCAYSFARIAKGN